MRAETVKLAVVFFLLEPMDMDCVCAYVSNKQRAAEIVSELFRMFACVARRHEDHSGSKRIISNVLQPPNSGDFTVAVMIAMALSFVFYKSQKM